MIQVGISDDALADLDEGFWFYEKQASGLGDYFSSCLRGDIEGLKVTGGIHRKAYKDYHRALSRVSHTRFSTRSRTTRWWCGQLWIAGGILSGLTHILTGQPDPRQTKLDSFSPHI